MPAPAAPPAASSARPRWVPACVALGSNLGDPVQQVQRAFAALATLPHCQLVLQSSLYRTRPLGPVEQPDFVNAAAALLTQLEAPALLQALKALEQSLGRAAPVVRWGPRLIDLDLLVHGATRMQEPSLTVPHPGIAERAFVLLPLAEICPSLVVPGVGRVSMLLQRLDTSGCERLVA
jgi:2-amino-4-hydroxy-6-hydroxymethyldihydropteridine diphosphokinase